MFIFKNKQLSLFFNQKNQLKMANKKSVSKKVETKKEVASKKAVAPKKVVAPKKEKITKTSMVLAHLTLSSSITSLEAIKLFSATRLSAIIFTLRKKGHNIVTTSLKIKDRYGNDVTYGKYTLLGNSKKVVQSVSLK
jgi:hypothetical protein